MGERRSTLDTDPVPREAGLVVLDDELVMLTGLAFPGGSKCCGLSYLHLLIPLAPLLQNLPVAA